MTVLIIILLLVLFILWNTTLFGYKDRTVHPIESDESQVFGPQAKSIILTKKGNTTAILQVHGFPSTPSIYSYSSERFHEAGMDVYVPLLPGFGTDPKIFEETTFTQWFDYLCRTYERLRGQYDQLFVLGISMGGMMSLKLGETYCDTPLAPDAIVSIAAPVVYNSLRDGIVTDWRQYFMRTLALFRASIGAKVVQGVANSEDGGEDWYGYGGLFLRPGLSLVHAMKRVRKDLHKITCPLFIMHDKGDRTVPFGNLKIIANGQRSRDFKILETEMHPYNHTRHALLAYHSVQEKLTSTIIDFLQEERDEHEKA
jgi:carboxylesterase